MKLLPKIALLSGLGLASLIGIPSTLYKVSQAEHAVITQFGQPKKVIINPVKEDDELVKRLKADYEGKGISLSTKVGLKVKIPLVQKVNKLDRRLIAWDGYPEQIPTKDKKYIWVDTTARWYIEDPLKFIQNVRTIGATQGRLDDIIDSAVRDNISNKNLIESVRSSNRELLVTERELLESGNIEKVYEGREKIEQEISQKVTKDAEEYGIRVVNVKIKGISYVESVKQEVEQRMITERKRIAEKYRSEGQGESEKILGKKEKEYKRIMSEAYREAETIKGKADAEATNIYAQAYSKDPEFYQFLKTLEAYRKLDDLELVIGTDNDFFQYLKSYKPRTK